MAQCVTCGASLKLGTTRCVKCGTVLEVATPPPAQPAQYAPPPQAVQQPQIVYVQQPPRVPVCTKSKTTAGILAILLGSIGVHKFYLGKTGQGILYLLFCWTWIPAIVGFIEGIVYLTMSETAFCQKYGQK